MDDPLKWYIVTAPELGTTTSLQSGLHSFSSFRAVPPKLVFSLILHLLAQICPTPISLSNCNPDVISSRKPSWTPKVYDAPTVRVLLTLSSFHMVWDNASRAWIMSNSTLFPVLSSRLGTDKVFNKSLLKEREGKGFRINPILLWIH